MRAKQIKKLPVNTVRNIPVKMPLKILAEPDPVFIIKPEFRYEKHILNLQTIQGFYNEWISRFAYSKNNEAAYESTEVFFETYFGKRRFKDYDSFRSSISQWLKHNK
jgi:hypothetical protein